MKKRSAGLGIMLVIIVVVGVGYMIIISLLNGQKAQDGVMREIGHKSRKRGPDDEKVSSGLEKSEMHSEEKQSKKSLHQKHSKETTDQAGDKNAHTKMDSSRKPAQPGNRNEQKETSVEYVHSEKSCAPDFSEMKGNKGRLLRKYVDYLEESSVKSKTVQKLKKAGFVKKGVYYVLHGKEYRHVVDKLGFEEGDFVRAIYKGGGGPPPSFGSRGEYYSFRHAILLDFDGRDNRIGAQIGPPDPRSYMLHYAKLKKLLNKHGYKLSPNN